MTRQPAAQRTRLVDVPGGVIGGCCCLQNLVTAIESWGQTQWQ